MNNSANLVSRNSLHCTCTVSKNIQTQKDIFDRTPCKRTPKRNKNPNKLDLGCTPMCHWAQASICTFLKKKLHFKKALWFTPICMFCTCRISLLASTVPRLECYNGFSKIVKTFPFVESQYR